MHLTRKPSLIEDYNNYFSNVLPLVTFSFDPRVSTALEQLNLTYTVSR